MEIHHLAALHQEGKSYIEFLRTGSMSAGVYRLPVGGNDLQKPHNEEEVYFVVSGRGRFTNGLHDEAVAAGDVVFVDAKEPHRFHEISEALEILVLFSPAEGTTKP